MSKPVRTVGIAAALHKPRAVKSAAVLCRALGERGLSVLLAPGLEKVCGEADGVGLRELAKADLVIALGGDGTLLAVAHHAGPQGTPLLGVDLGSFGFLAGESFEGLLENLDGVLAGEYRVERRMMVSADVTRGGETVASFCGLNDAVVGKADIRRLVRLHTCINGEHIATYPADGLIISTPTGSTAYALSAGGPLVSPSVECLVIVPICPHTLYSRPLVVEATAVIQVSATPRDHAAGGLTLTVDGQDAVTLERGDEVVIHRAGYNAKLVRLSPGGFYERLRTKLKWGAER